MLLLQGTVEYATLIAQVLVLHPAPQGIAGDTRLQNRSNALVAWQLRSTLCQLGAALKMLQEQTLVLELAAELPEITRPTTTKPDELRMS